MLIHIATSVEDTHPFQRPIPTTKAISLVLELDSLPARCINQPTSVGTPLLLVFLFGEPFALSRREVGICFVGVIISDVVVAGQARIHFGLSFDARKAVLNVVLLGLHGSICGGRVLVLTLGPRLGNRYRRARCESCGRLGGVLAVVRARWSLLLCLGIGGVTV